MADNHPTDELTAQLQALGFALMQRDRQGFLQYARKPNRYLTEWIHDDGQELLVTWEFEMGEFCAAQGWQIGAAETTFQILYPQFDAKIARDISTVTAELQRVESRLSALDLVTIND